MKNITVSLILKTLAEKSGKKLEKKELLKLFRSPQETSETKNKDKEKEKGKGKRKPKFKKERDSESSNVNPEAVLTDLVEIGLLEVKKDSYHVKHPFTLLGRISFSPRGFAFVVLKFGGADDVFVAPPNNGGALPGDEVEVRLTGRKRERFEGKVVSVKQRARESYRLKLESGPRQGVVLGRVLDMPLKLNALITVKGMSSDDRKRLKRDTVVIGALTGTQTRYRGDFVQEAYFTGFEEDRKEDPDFGRILMKYNLEANYPSSVTMPKFFREPDDTSVRDWHDRHDCRDLFTITIDGASTKDFDDALSLEKLNDTHWRLYVHIADVSYYVRPRTKLDDEAKERATSVYLADGVVPMLPPVLSEQLCSLVAGRNRLAFTAQIDVNPTNGKIIGSRFYKSIVWVDQRLTYDMAESQLNNKGGFFRKLFKKRIGLVDDLWVLAQKQRELRQSTGRVDLNIPEPLPKKNDQNQITGFSYRDRLKSSILIEECMLSANVVVARFLKKKKAHTLYRVHETMDAEKLTRLNEFFKIYKINHTLKKTSPMAVQNALGAVSKNATSDVVERVFNFVLLRSFMQAKYDGRPDGHWGLGFEDYCHFTSPIRRYPDLVVHRALQAVLNGEREVYNQSDIRELGTHTSDRERKAMDAERDMMKIKMLRYVERTGKKRFTALVTGFKSDRVFLELQDIPVEGIVLAEHLTNEGELSMPNDFSVYIKKLKRPAFLGERWEVEMESLDVEAMQLLFKPIWSKAKKVFG